MRLVEHLEAMEALDLLEVQVMLLFLVVIQNVAQLVELVVAAAVQEDLVLQYELVAAVAAKAAVVQAVDIFGPVVTLVAAVVEPELEQHMVMVGQEVPVRNIANQAVKNVLLTL